MSNQCKQCTAPAASRGSLCDRCEVTGQMLEEAYEASGIRGRSRYSMNPKKTRWYFATLRSELWDGEAIYRIADGAWDGPDGFITGSLIATNYRVLFIGDHYGQAQMRQFLYRDLVNVVPKRFTFGDSQIYFYTPAGRAGFAQIPKGTENTIGSFIRERAHSS